GAIAKAVGNGYCARTSGTRAFELGRGAAMSWAKGQTTLCLRLLACELPTLPALGQPLDPRRGSGTEARGDCGHRRSCSPWRAAGPAIVGHCLLLAEDVGLEAAIGCKGCRPLLEVKGGGPQSRHLVGRWWRECRGRNAALVGLHCQERGPPDRQRGLGP